MKNTLDTCRWLDGTEVVECMVVLLCSFKMAVTYFCTVKPVDSDFLHSVILADL